MSKRLLVLMISVAVLPGCEPGDGVSGREKTADCQEKAWKEGVACIEIYDPVCGCNNKTYSNACYAQAHGVSVSYSGECKK
jgi:hypothetical protein